MDDLTPEVKTIALAFMEGLDCARSLMVAILIREKAWVEIAELSCPPGDYASADAFRTAYAATSFLRKFPGLPTGIDCEEVAKLKWREAEVACYKANERLSPYIFGAAECDERIADFLSEVRAEVVHLIGYGPRDALDGAFGPGATVSDKSRLCTIPDKMSSVPTFTQNAVYHLVPWTGTAWAQGYASDRATLHSDSIPRSVRGNYFFTVPKDATTHRGCAKEPSVNAFYQLGAGKELRDTLKRRTGLSLEAVPDWHQIAAREGSYFGDIATIDLSSASDTVSFNLVKLLLPTRWFDLLESLRSPYTFFEGRWVRLEKFSSMGNGYTFELETVLFLALARAAVRLNGGVADSVSVYGDDIIVPVEQSVNVLSALKFCGFTPNGKKTYDKGVFRESCGGDFFLGEAVRPYFLKKEPNEPQDFIGIANGLKRFSRGYRQGSRGWSRIARCWLRVISYLPVAVRNLRGPAELGDIVLTDESEDRWVVRWRNSIRYIRVYRPAKLITVRWEGFGAGAQMAAALYLAGAGRLRPTRNFDGSLTPRDPVTGYKIGWTPRS